MTTEQRDCFYSEYEHASRGELTGVLLALFLGGIGLHRFYLGEARLGMLYLIFCWTGIPTILGFFECFLMPSRVRDGNAVLAYLIMADIVEAGEKRSLDLQRSRSWRACSECGQTTLAGMGFCASCSTNQYVAG